MVNSTIFDESDFFMVKASVCCWVKEHVYPLEVKPSIFLVGGLEHDFFLSIQLGISSSQLTNAIIFQRGRYTTNQIGN